MLLVTIIAVSGGEPHQVSERVAFSIAVVGLQVLLDGDLSSRLGGAGCRQQGADEKKGASHRLRIRCLPVKIEEPLGGSSMARVRLCYDYAASSRIRMAWNLSTRTIVASPKVIETR